MRWTGRAAWGLAVTGLCLGTAALAVASRGNVLLTVAPPLVLALLYVLWRAPLRTSVLVLVALGLVAESPTDRPGDGLWYSPLLALGTPLLYNFSATTGIAALPFSGMDALVAWLLGVSAWRRLTGTEKDTPAPVAGCLGWAMVAYVAALVGLMAWGVVRGGDAVRAYWQLHMPAHLALFVLLLGQTLRGPSEHVLLGRLLVGVALVKTAVGLFFYAAVVLPRGLKPEYLTTHGDTLLFLGALLVVGAHWLEAPGWGTLRRCLLVGPPVVLAILLNDRRIAYVAALGLGVLVLALLPRGPTRRTLARLGLLCLPLLALYIAVGWRSEATLFRPLAALRTMSDSEKDLSTLSREVEDYNLSQTLWRHPVLGMGLGQEYVEVMKGPDLQLGFENYRYYPHNTVLWLLAVGGVVGLPWLLAPVAVGAFLAARCYRKARRPVDRAAALVCLGILLLYLTQAYGDMGLHGWSSVLLASQALVVTGKLAVAVGAWPATRTQPHVEAACPMHR